MILYSCCYELMNYWRRNVVMVPYTVFHIKCPIEDIKCRNSERWLDIVAVMWAFIPGFKIMYYTAVSKSQEPVV